MPPLEARRLQDEWMDQADLDRRLHEGALRGLARLNWASNSGQILWRPIRQLLSNTAERPLTVLDIASGGGDVTIDLWRRATAAGEQLQITGCDISPTAVEHARQAAKKTGAAVEFVERDILADPPEKSYDIVVCSLFLHHLTREKAVTLLKTMQQTTRQLLLVNDLHRSLAGYVLAVAACRLLTRSPVVHVDGPRSVEGAFTKAELRELAHEAGLRDATVSRRWPSRMLLQWKAKP